MYFHFESILLQKNYWKHEIGTLMYRDWKYRIIVFEHFYTSIVKFVNRPSSVRSVQPFLFLVKVTL